MALLDLEPISIDASVEVMHLCFPFTSRNQFESAARGYVRRFKPKLTIINSTVLPGTTRRLSAATSAHIVYSPVRGKHARMARELLHYSKFVSGLDGRAVQAARNHFKRLA
jgi:UDP-N-acetyl-D-mannosaminuronate dehydrogenase